MFEILKAHDSVVFDLIAAEQARQETQVRLIASENYETPAVTAAKASSFANRYSEGYPHLWKDGEKILENGRYYNGQAITNELEQLTISRALDLFVPGHQSEYHANVQPLSGAPANFAVLNAFLMPGDTFMGMSLDHGGHLTHGHKVNITSKFFKAIQYPLGSDNLLDYDLIRELAIQHRPKLIFAGATAYTRSIDFAAFGEIAKEVGAILVADISHISGLVVANEHPHPFPHADIVTSTTHKILRGPRGGIIICKKAHGPRIDRSVFPGMQGGPHMNTLCALAVALKDASSDQYKDYVRQVKSNAQCLAQTLSQRGFSLVTGGTDTHMVLVDISTSNPDLRVKNGAVMSDFAESANIIFNKNAVPGDKKPMFPSGFRLGTPAVTTIGMREAEMEKIGNWIADIAIANGSESVTKQVKDDVMAMMLSFPVPQLA